MKRIKKIDVEDMAWLKELYYSYPHSHITHSALNALGKIFGISGQCIEYNLHKSIREERIKYSSSWAKNILERFSDYQRRYYKKNRKRVNEYARIYYLEHLYSQRKKNREYYYKNKERIKMNKLKLKKIWKEN